MEENIKKQIIDYIQSTEYCHADISKLKANIKSPLLDKILYDMLRSGELIYKGKKYKLNQEKTLKGTIHVDEFGLKYVKTEKNKKIVLNEMSLYSVLDKDIVTYRIIDGEAYISSIVERNKKLLTFQIDLSNGKKYLKFYGGKFSIDSTLSDLSNYNVGDFVLVDIESNKIIRKISDKDNPNRRDIAIGANYGFDNYYSDMYLNEIEEIKDKFKGDIIDDRYDFRQMPFYTIDCDNTRDIDDSTSFIIDKNKDTIYKIDNFADTTHYIKYKGEIYNSAFERGTSAYSSRYVFPMLHPELSNNICSLNPNEDRLTKFLITEFDMSGNIKSRKIGYGIMNSNMQMKYSEVDKLLQDDPTLSHTYLPFKENLLLFKKISDQIGARLISDGKIEFANQETNVIFNDMLQAEGLSPLDGPISRKMIEYAMVDGNAGITSILSNHNMPLIYRNHLKPDIDKLDKAMIALSTQGFDTSIYFKSGSIQAFLKKYMNDPIMYKYISNYLLSSGAIKSAFYSNKNYGHYALGINDKKGYAKFSSSIRLFGDLHNHYCFDAYMKNDKDLENELRIDSEEVATQCNLRESAAEAFENECKANEIIDIAEKNIGLESKGIVSSLHYNKYYVRLDNGIHGIIYNNICLDIEPGDIICAKISSVNKGTKEVILDYVCMVNKRHTSKKRIKKL